MANFQTHANAGIIASTLTASSLLHANAFTYFEIIILWFLGLLGSLLPDIDSDNSSAIRLIFTLLAIACSVLTAVVFHTSLSLLGLWLLCASVFIAVRFGLMPIFEGFTIHRATLHSVLAGLLFCLTTVQICQWLGKGAVFCWSAGLFVFLGMLVHLVLDECYSVDLANISVKRSFGSALKLIDTSYPLTTLGHLAACGYLWLLSPPIAPFLHQFNQLSVTWYSSRDWVFLQGLFGGG